MEVFRKPAPVGLFPGNGGRWSKEMLPPIREGRLPGWEEDRLLPVGNPRGDAPGSEEDVDLGADPMDVVESAGDDERDVGGADDLVVLR